MVVPQKSATLLMPPSLAVWNMLTNDCFSVESSEELLRVGNGVTSCTKLNAQGGTRLALLGFQASVTHHADAAENSWARVPLYAIVLGTSDPSVTEAPGLAASCATSTLDCVPTWAR